MVKYRAPVSKEHNNKRIPGKSTVTDKIVQGDWHRSDRGTVGLFLCGNMSETKLTEHTLKQTYSYKIVFNLLILKKVLFPLKIERMFCDTHHGTEKPSGEKFSRITMLNI